MLQRANQYTVAEALVVGKCEDRKRPHIEKPRSSRPGQRSRKSEAPSGPSLLPSPSATSLVGHLFLPLHLHHRRCSTRTPSPFLPCSCRRPVLPHPQPPPTGHRCPSPRKPPPPLLPASVASAVAPSSLLLTTDQHRLYCCPMSPALAVGQRSLFYCPISLSQPQSNPYDISRCPYRSQPSSDPTAIALTPVILAATASSPSAASSSIGHCSSSSSSPSAIPVISHCSRYNPLPQPPSHSRLQPSVAHTHIVTTSSLLSPFFPAPCLPLPPPVVGRYLPFFPTTAASPLPPLLCYCSQLLPCWRTVAPPPLPAAAAHLCLCRCCRGPLAATVASSRALLIFFPLQPSQPQPPLVGPRCLPGSHFFFLAGPSITIAPPLRRKLMPLT
ncbi:hypothetical protein B296_00045725 [Ensete ventricosum]|uniref:Uncharacterized protein n=1 Tax=Ensete ventricosum TaxID=4639 RepID=A0A426Z3V2_ENSVE|nr:hypothetical protein B296_00045725 [Ensete ventricosum]